MADRTRAVQRYGAASATVGRHESWTTGVKGSWVQIPPARTAASRSALRKAPAVRSGGEAGAFGQTGCPFVRPPLGWRHGGYSAATGTFTRHTCLQTRLVWTAVEREGLPLDEACPSPLCLEA